MLGAQLRNLRRKNQLTQKQLAEKLRKRTATVGGWESDNIMPAVDVLVALADFFNVSTDYLLDRREDGRFEGDFIEVTGLTPEQIATIQFLVGELLK